MKSCLLASALTCFAACVQAQNVTVHNSKLKVDYTGLARNGIEIFLNIKYGDDTGGQNRFKPPRPFKSAPNTIIDATNEGPACPQQLGTYGQPLTLANITTISEDCLNLNVARPAGTTAKSKLPVLLWIHGGGFWVGSNTEPSNRPDGMIQESVENGLPIIHVAINYRLGLFGFAQSAALKEEGSENAGLRDQRLAIEWVRDNIANFGGDPKKITIAGQSSGGLAVGMQLLAYGGTKPLPYQQGICESQALEAGITGNYTIDAMTAVANYIGCNATSIHSAETLACLRKYETQPLFDASAATKTSANIGDIWLPSVDGDFIPAPPSQLIKEGRFGDATYMMGWTDADLNAFTPYSLETHEETYNFFTEYLPAVPEPLITELLELYPVEEFTPPPGTNLTAEFYRTARIFRDIVMVCQPLFFTEGIRNKTRYASGSSASSQPDSYPPSERRPAPPKVYLYDFNQTILEPIIEHLTNVTHTGPVHTSEFPYIFGNLSAYNINDWPWDPKPEDYELLKHASRSWSTFVATGKPSLKGKQTLQGWGPAYEEDEHGWEGDELNLYIIGGPYQSFSPIDGKETVEVLSAQRLRGRCELLNSEKFIEGMGF